MGMFPLGKAFSVASPPSRHYSVWSFSWTTTWVASSQAWPSPNMRCGRCTLTRTYTLSHTHAHAHTNTHTHTHTHTQGLFASRGLDVEITPPCDPGSECEAVLRGQLDESAAADGSIYLGSIEQNNLITGSNSALMAGHSLAVGPHPHPQPHPHPHPHQNPHLG